MEAQSNNVEHVLYSRSLLNGVELGYVSKQQTIEWLRERTEHLDIFLFFPSILFFRPFYFRCSVHWWKRSVRF